MSEVLKELKYSKEHEWVRIEGNLAVVGITDYAQNSLHEITYVEINEVGTALEVNQECGLVESMKASSDIFSPLAGEIVEVNTALEDAPEAINNAPYAEGWMFKLKPSNLDGDLAALMDADAYKDYIASLEKE